MYPDRTQSLPGRQRGFLVPTALFIIVVMGLAALALWRTTSQTNTSAVQELLSTQAFYAAESGVQTGLSRVFYPNASSRTLVDNNCTGLDQTVDFSDINGLNVCQVRVQCTLNAPGSYTLTSEGRCASGDLRAERSLEVHAKF